MNSEVFKIDSNKHFHKGKSKKANFVLDTIFESMIMKVKIIPILFESKLQAQVPVYIREDITSSSGAYIIDFVILGGGCMYKQVCINVYTCMQCTFETHIAHYIVSSTYKAPKHTAHSPRKCCVSGCNSNSDTENEYVNVHRFH